LVLFACRDVGGVTRAKADSSAALRNDNKRTGNGKDKYGVLSAAAARWAAFGRDDDFGG
jgi:hypothetical protein